MNIYAYLAELEFAQLKLLRVSQRLLNDPDVERRKLACAVVFDTLRDVDQLAAETREFLRSNKCEQFAFLLANFGRAFTYGRESRHAKMLCSACAREMGVSTDRLGQMVANEYEATTWPLPAI